MNFSDRINPFFFHHQLSVVNGQHFYDAVIADHALGNAGIKAVPVQVIHPVYIQLARSPAGAGTFMVPVVKDIQRQAQRPVHFPVQVLHQPRPDLLVGYTLHKVSVSSACE